MGEARAVLLPHHDEVLGCVEEPWKQWRDIVMPLMPRVHARYRPNVMWGFIESQMRVRFGDVRGVELVEEGQRVMLGFKGKLLLRFKLMDADRMTRNFPTDTSNRFEEQQELPLYADLPRVTVGYRPNSLGTELLEVVVFFRVGAKLMWEYPLIGSARVHQLEFGGDFAATAAPMVGPAQSTSESQETAAPVSPPKRRRVTVKPEALPEERKEGTKDGEKSE